MRGTILMMSQKPVRKAVIGAAGFGTRFLPQTKAMPKEMLPLVDKPIIQYIVEELAEAGIEDIVIVTGYHKRSIEDHFDQMSGDLRANLKQGGKTGLLEQTKHISELANFAYVRQKGSYGAATALLNVSHLIGDEPFIFIFADDLIPSSPNRFTQMIELYEEFGGSILPCIRVKHKEDYKRYGIVGGDQVRDGVIKMDSLVEKPGKTNAPSNLASIGGYLLTPDVFKYAEESRKTLPDGAEFYLSTYALEPMLEDGKGMYACELKNSKYYDTGNKLGYLEAVIDTGLAHPEIGDKFRAYLEDRLKRE